MSSGSLLIHCFRVVNDCDEPVAVLPNVENYVSLYIVGIFERAANLRKIVPSNLFDDNHPCFDLVRRVLILLHGLVQMLTRDDMHHKNHTSQYVKSSRTKYIQNFERRCVVPICVAITRYAPGWAAILIGFVCGFICAIVGGLIWAKLVPGFETQPGNS
jgi:hypothetical protein